MKSRHHKDRERLINKKYNTFYYKIFVISRYLELSKGRLYFRLWQQRG